jgi:hypothetical protein
MFKDIARPRRRAALPNALAPTRFRLDPIRAAASGIYPSRSAEAPSQGGCCDDRADGNRDEHGEDKAVEEVTEHVAGQSPRPQRIKTSGPERLAVCCGRLNLSFEPRITQPELFVARPSRLQVGTLGLMLIVHLRRLRPVA